jgi:hypothetical protein
VAGNIDSNAIWATLREKHASGMGAKIARYDEKTSEWKEDKTVSVGARGPTLVVNSKGLPAFI